MRKAIIFLFTICILLSCGRGYREAMDIAQSRMVSAPDSSLTILQGMDGQALSTRGLRARYALLLTMARDKCYMDVSRDTTIRTAYDWYQHHGSKQEHMLSAYYLGVVQQQAGNSLEAALAFREAEPLAKDLADYRQLSLIEQHLSAIFASKYDHVRALEYAQQSLDAAIAAGDSLMADYCRYDVARQLLAEYRYNDAEVIVNRILSNSKKDSYLYSAALRQRARILLYREPHDYEGAKALYDEINSLGTIKYMAEDYGLLALLEQEKGNVAGADSYIKQELSLLDDEIDSLVYYNDCYNLYEKRGEWKTSLDFLSKRSNLQDRIVMGLLAQSETHALELHYQENLTLVQLQAKYHRYAGEVAGLVFFLIIVSLVVLLNMKNRRLLEEMATIQEFSEDLDRLKASNFATYRIVEDLISDKVHSLQQLSESYFSWEDSAVKKREQKNGMLMKDDIISLFRRQLGELRDEHAFIESLEHSLNIKEGGLMKRARQLLNQEKELDFSILTLLFSGFSIKSMSYLLRMSEASLRMRKTRYKQRFESLPEQERTLFLAKLG